MKNKIAFGAILAYTALFWLVTTPSTIVYTNTAYGQEQQAKQGVQTVKEQPKAVETQLTGQLRRICACESTGKPYLTPTHYKNGKVIRGVVNSKDIGMCQINLTYHEKTARKLGLDLFKEQDNVTYAKWLYKAQGAQPWTWSKSCWK